jgi:hypothetical protein
MADDEEPTVDDEGEQETGDSGGSGLAKRVGPLPIWGWIVVVIGGIVVWRIIKNRNAASSGVTGGTQGNNALPLFGTEGFSTNSAGQIVDNATGDILGSFPGGTNSTGSSGTGTLTAAQWFSNAQQTLFNLGYDSAAVDQALQDYAAGNHLPQNEYGIIEAAIRLTGNPPSGIALPVLQKPKPPSSGGSGTASNALPYLNSQSFPITVLFGQYGPNDYTKVGTVVNGQYQGNAVSGGAPVYAGLFGGFEQDFNMATLPNGTNLYVPTSLVNQGYAKAA